MEKVGGFQRDVDDDSSASVRGDVAESENISSQILISPPDNPMIMDVVLKNLFELSRPRELNHYRLICKHWYNVALPAWLKNGSAKKIKSDAAFLKFLKEVHLAPSTAANDDIVGMKKYRKFHLEHHNQIYNRLHFEVFWNACGQHLTHLTLKNFKIPDVVAFRDILFCKFTPKLEYLVMDVQSVERHSPVDPELLNYGLPAKNLNLKTLMIDIEDVNDMDYGEEYGLVLEHGPIPLDWKSLLGNFPNLKNFGVGRGMSRVESQVDEILMAIKEIRAEDKRNLDLKSLIWCFNLCRNCHSNYDDPRASSIKPLLLRQCQLRLEAVRLVFFFRNNDDGERRRKREVIEGLLSIHSTTLKKLELYADYGADPLEYPPFPEMPQLHTLELIGYPIDDLAFLRKLPNLRSLRMWDNNTASFISAGTADQPDMMGMIAFPSISEFYCDNDEVKWDANDFAELSRLMPNINDLSLALWGPRDFPLVCQYFPRVEQLTIIGDHDIGDDMILGVITEEEDGDGEQGSCGQANITRLRNLKSLNLQAGNKFTRNSVLYGLLGLPRLEKLVIDLKWMTKGNKSEMKDFILEKLPFANVITDWDRNCSVCKK